MEEEAERLAERAARQKEMPGHPSGAHKAKIGCMKAFVFAVPVATVPPSDEASGVEAVSPTMYEQAGMCSQLVSKIGRKGNVSFV